MNEFEVRVCGIPCIARITYWEPYVPAFISGPPDKCYPEEGGDIEYELLDMRGRPAEWLERKMSDSDRDALYNQLFDLLMEDQCQ